MKTIYTLLLVTGLFFAMNNVVIAQENHGNALNLFVRFGDNSSVSGNYEFQVHPDITVSPMADMVIETSTNIAIVTLLLNIMFFPHFL